MSIIYKLVDGVKKITGEGHKKAVRRLGCKEAIDNVNAVRRLSITLMGLDPVGNENK